MKFLFYTVILLLTSCVWDSAVDVDEPEEEKATTFAELNALDFDFKAHNDYSLEMHIPRAHARKSAMVTVYEGNDFSKVVYRGNSQHANKVILPLSLCPMKKYSIKVETSFDTYTSTFETSVGPNVITINSQSDSDL